MDLFRFISIQGLHRSTIAIAIDLIYAATGLEYPIDKIILGIPIAVDPRPDLDTDPNTFVPVISVSIVFDARFDSIPNDGFLYRRIPLSLLTGSDNVIFEEPTVFPFSTYEILDGINEKLNTQLTTDDVLDDIYTTPGAPLRLRANPKSLAWLDEIVILYDEFDGGRLLEDVSSRITEDGTVRILESELS